MESKGLDNKKARDVLLRAIKEARLSIYLGPLLKVLTGTTMSEIWPSSEAAIGWLNTVRNNIAHQGLIADRDTAGKAIFVCIKTLAGLNNHGLVSVTFPPGMFREARILAAHTLDRPDWAPSTHEEVENDPFDTPIRP